MASSSDHLGRACSDSSSWLLHHHHHHLLSFENDPLMMMSSGAAAPQMITRLAAPTHPQQQHENETSSSSAADPPRPLKRKKRSRSSSSSRKNSLTTFIAADAANFRHMVQQITGGTTGNAAAPILKPAPQRPMPAPQSADHGGGLGFQAGFLPCFPVLESHVNSTISALVSSSTYFTG